MSTSQMALNSGKDHRLNIQFAINKIAVWSIYKENRDMVE
jgi:hypothetical protein